MPFPFRSGLASVSLFTALACVTPLEAAVYYVDAGGGNDSANGLSPSTARKTLTRINSAPYQPGDSLLFKRGERYAGQFAPSAVATPTSGSGTEANPIFVGAYGSGDRPLIEGEGLVQDAVVLKNRSWWTITDLEITNQGAARAVNSRRTGILLTSDNFGVMRGVRLRDLIVRDVNGSLVKHNTNEGHGILFSSIGTSGSVASRFDDLIIENCLLQRTDRNGISQYTANGSRSTKVIIRDNVLEDIGGDGIKIWGSDYAVVERNVVRGGRMRAQDHAAGIWPFEAVGTVIQFNEVSGMKGTTDGMGYDADYRCDSTYIQYNYSHDNEGGFILLCAPGNSFSRNTVVRYNISVRDGINSARVIQLGGKITNSRIYNNTFYTGAAQDVPLIASNEWDGGNADSTYFYNNIFYVEAGGRVSYVWDKSKNNFFDNNVFYGNHALPPADPHGQTARPPFANPPPGLSDTGGANVFRLSAPIRDSMNNPVNGRVIPDNGGRDYFGNPVAAAGPVSVGAYQFTGIVDLLRISRPIHPDRNPGHPYVDLRGALSAPPDARHPRAALPAAK